MTSIARKSSHTVLDAAADAGLSVTAANYFADLQNRICSAFEKEDGHGHFVETVWDRGPEHRLKGGGRMRIMRSSVFEKVGVNFSHVWGNLPESAIPQIPGAKESGGRFSATGVSLVSHMANPFVPIVHMNVRCMQTSRMWFGGGADLTPTFPFDIDTAAFHAAMRGACDGYRRGAYEEYKAWCDRYFYLPHRKEPRGVGGIFFDELNSGDLEKDFAFVQAVAEAFLRVYPPIVARRKHTPYTAADLEKLQIKRGRYVEFNLVYDRGTKFGFQTDANPDAYLMSMPPTACWP